MIPCPSCKRHLREHELKCPFCSVDVQRAHVFATLALTALGLLGTTACSSDANSTDDGQSTTTQATTTDTGSETSTSTTNSTESSDSADTLDTSMEAGGSFYAGPPDHDFIWNSDCDPFVQDCPEGEKCVPYASGGVTWDANKCVLITGAGAPGDACSYGGIVEATDDCDATSHCWHMQDVDGQQLGVCTEFCQGSPDEPVCPEGDSCVIANQGSINSCFDACDPLAQDCGNGFGCVWLTDAFVCTLANDEAVGSVCDFLADCPSGTACVDAALVPDCAGNNCCAAYCSLDAPSCEAPGTECVSWFEEGQAPPGFEDLGVCVVSD